MTNETLKSLWEEELSIHSRRLKIYTNWNLLNNTRGRRFMMSSTCGVSRLHKIIPTYWTKTHFALELLGERSGPYVTQLYTQKTDLFTFARYECEFRLSAKIHLPSILGTELHGTVSQRPRIQTSVYHPPPLLRCLSCFWNDQYEYC